MSLAPTLGAAGPRISSFLPAIKCSSCGDEIEIAAMGDHVCGQTAAQHVSSVETYSSHVGNPYALDPPSPPRPKIIPMPSMPMIPDPLEIISPDSEFTMRDRAPTLPDSDDTGGRLPRVILPKINPDAANKPFLAPRHDSPMSPTISVRSNGSSGRKPNMSRSATTPIPRLYNPHPPSPEFSANIDCAFPPFPTQVGNNSRPSTSNGRRTPIEQEPRRRPAQLDLGLTPGSGSLDMEPKSPRLNAGESVLQRFNTLKSGPFNAKKLKTPSGDAKPGSSWFSKRRPSETPTEKPQVQDTIPAAGQPEFESSPPQNRFVPQRPTRPTTGELFNPRFLDQFSAEPGVMPTHSPSPLQTSSSSSDLERSQTYPSQDQNLQEAIAPEPLAKVHSEPALPNSGYLPTQPDLTTSKPFSPLRDHSNSIEGADSGSVRLDHRLHDAPPVPRPVQRHRQESINAPSESGYSTVSSSNSANNSSRRPSQVTSAASSIEAFSHLNFDSHKYADDEQTLALDPKVRHHDKDFFTAKEIAVRTPPQNFAHVVTRRPSSSASEVAQIMPLESPMDPALKNQAGIASIVQPQATSPSKLATSHTNVLQHPAARGPMPPGPPLSIPNNPRVPGPGMPGNWQPVRRDHENPQGRFNGASPVTRVQSPNLISSPMTPLDPHARPASRRGNSNKATCRGCGQIIEGKSVKAADGRLTGRWHKACFVCRSCREPFTTADFYVIKNEPYCEQHYHEHNGSLCAGCHRGIEGQYIETSSTARPGSRDRKFHPRCFTCWECRSVLADDYFEINGKVFCERHALAAMRAQARTVGGGGGGGINGSTQFNSRNLAFERRTTRLMMMA